MNLFDIGDVVRVIANNYNGDWANDCHVGETGTIMVVYEPNNIGHYRYDVHFDQSLPDTWGDNMRCVAENELELADDPNGYDSFESDLAKLIDLGGV